ncbi:hypothetical protein JTB14_037843 [Gonioctena quinquepunctata]|nr:hypothetical protein JTB14_037843 [Gonioctena quinquepunctata]
MESSLNLQIAEQQEMINSLKNQLKTLQNLNAEIEAKTDKNICSSMDTIPMTYADKSTRTELVTDNIQHPRGVDKGSMTETEKELKLICLRDNEVMETKANRTKSIKFESFQSKTEECTTATK